MFTGIEDASHIEKHPWEKLHKIFKDLQSKYVKCINNNKQSGTHDHFQDFCNNRPDCYYLHLWLCDKPNFMEVVTASLPAIALMETYLGCHHPSPTFSEKSDSGM